MSIEKYVPKNPPVHGEHVYLGRPDAATVKQIKEKIHVFTTQAGQIAQQLDAQDGTKDGMISASVWNDYARSHGGAEIQNAISVENATKSITTYMVREAQGADETSETEETDEAPEADDTEAPEGEATSTFDVKS